jgi:hypothetical protein
MYLCIEEDKQLRVLTEEDIKNPKFYNSLTHGFWYTKLSEIKESEINRIKKANLGVYKESMIKIHKELNSPIFKIYTTRIGDGIGVDERFPKLSEIKGVSTLLPPEEIYKDIIHFMGNVMRNNPDESKIVNISNKSKIIKGGFDYITSFRNMKG